MNEISYVVEIQRPVDDVFAVLESFDRFPEWNSGVTQSRLASPGPLGVGSEAVAVGRLLGRTYEMRSVFTAYVKNQMIASRTVSGPFHLEIQYLVEPIPGGTRFTTVVRGESKGFLKVAEPVALSVTRKQFESASENLKALMEADRE
ncbi:MAG TPA: SRPBCC family protein [Candidatus Dormibacteraeota bacterium]|nr:SRPBCC family protein [Candidatus Dormibacteraeota bacterium]